MFEYVNNKELVGIFEPVPCFVSVESSSHTVLKLNESLSTGLISVGLSSGRSLVSEPSTLLASVSEYLFKSRTMFPDSSIVSHFGL